MEASTLKIKKPINKGKIKKTLKNVLCRPDPAFWPLISDEHKNILEKMLCQYKVDIPQFHKPHWKQLKLIPKEKRPKPPKIKKVKGLVFGLSECLNAVKSNQCAAVLLEAGVNPRIIVQPLIEACVNARIPVLCVSDLKTISNNYFGIPTSCLCVEDGCLSELQNQVLDIAKNHKLPAKAEIGNKEPMEVLKEPSVPESNQKEFSFKCPYLYRTNKKTRVYTPSEGTNGLNECTQKFSGQDFVKCSDSMVDKKSYMKMILKKISNNPNRVKVKK